MAKESYLKTKKSNEFKARAARESLAARAAGAARSWGTPSSAQKRARGSESLLKRNLKPRGF